MTARTISRFVLAAVFVCNGCERAERTGDSAATASTNSIRVVLQPMGDTINAYRLDSPAWFSVPFTTVVPATLHSAASAEEGGESVNFSLGDEPPTSDDPFVHLFLHPRGTDAARARRYVETYAASRGVPISEAESIAAPLSEEGISPEGGSSADLVFPWAILEVPYAYNCARAVNNCAVGRVAMGKIRDRYFHVVVQYPPAQANEFVPRAQLIISQWRWR